VARPDRPKSAGAAATIPDLNSFDRRSKMNRIPKLVLLTALALSFAFVTGCASTAKQESTGEYFDDSVVTTKVKAAILNDPDLKVLQINVETFKGVVQLSGFVDSKAMMAHAVDVTRGVAGVKSVKDNMRVR
jgi:osmotically-inducible protein OsmY